MSQVRVDEALSTADPLAETAAVLYCIVPSQLAARLDRCLTRYGETHGVSIICERRQRDRRDTGDRRHEPWPSSEELTPGVLERRRVRNRDGRRVGERRATLVPVSAPAELPRRAASYAEQLVFVEPLELGSEHVEDLDTARLVTRAQAGEDALLADLYQRYFDRVYAYLRMALKDIQDAEDGAQQIFLQMMEALPAYELRAVPFRGWLFRIVRNYSINHLQKARRITLEEPAEIDRRRANEEDDPIDASVLRWLTDTDMLVLVGRLPEAQRQVVMLRYMMDLSSPEIAAIVDRSPDAVRQLQSRALSYLRSRLTALGRAPSTEAVRQPLQVCGRVRSDPVTYARRRALIAC